MRALPLLAPAAALLATLLTGCATGPSPTQIRLDNLDARVSKIERVVSNGSLVQLAQQQASLQAEVSTLRGRLDRLEQSNQRLSRQQHDLYADLSKRVSALEQQSTAEQAAIQAAAAASAGSGSAGSASGAGAAGSSGSAAAGASSNSGSIAGMLPGVTPTQQSVYEQAFGALKAGSYSVAISGFEGFLKGYPTSPLAPNAEYWLGETHFVDQHYRRAEQAFRSVFTLWPNSAKAPDAMLALGNVLLVQGRTHAGRAMLRQVVKQFPETDAAKRAAKRLIGKSAG